MKQCPKCQVMVKDTAKFCIKCGFNIKKFEEEQAATAEPVFCPECGTSCQSIDRFCPECGYEIAQDLSNPPAAEDVFSDNWLADIVDTSETTQAEDKTEFAAFTYEEHTDGTYTVTGLKDTGILRITLPEGVVEIGEGAFANSGILQAILPEGLLKIGKNAFAGCQLLNSVTLPSSLCVVEDEAFADCTRLEVEGGELMMYRPALSGSTIAKIRSITKPAMATVRTAAEGHKSVVIGIGYGVRDRIDEIQALARELNAEIVVSRKIVDNGYLPYELQLGLTGKSLHPPVYIAIGISGAVHHIVGMQNAGTVIAINPDPDAPIFDYADFGIVDHF